MLRYSDLLYRSFDSCICTLNWSSQTCQCIGKPVNLEYVRILFLRSNILALVLSALAVQGQQTDLCSQKCSCIPHDYYKVHWGVSILISLPKPFTTAKLPCFLLLLSLSLVPLNWLILQSPQFVVLLTLPHVSPYII